MHISYQMVMPSAGVVSASPVAQAENSDNKNARQSVQKRFFVGPARIPWALARRLAPPAPGLTEAAHAVAETVGRCKIRLCTSAPVRPDFYAFYRYCDGGNDLFVKVCIKQDVEERERTERLVAEAASAAGCSPRYFPTSHARVQVSAFTALRKVTWEQTHLPDFRARFAEKFRLFTALKPALLVDVTQNLDQNTLLGWSLNKKHYERNAAPQALSLASVHSLKKRSDWAFAQLSRAPASIVFSHFDLTRKNVCYLEKSDLLLIDFDKVGWSEQLRGYGQFYGYANLPPADVEPVLRLLYEREPKEFECRRFALWLTIMSIDHLWFKLYGRGNHRTAIRRKVAHIRQLELLLPDMPKL